MTTDRICVITNMKELQRNIILPQYESIRDYINFFDCFSNRNINKMLINNLEKHRQKYSKDKASKGSANRPTSLTFIPKNSFKTQKHHQTRHTSRDCHRKTSGHQINDSQTSISLSKSVNIKNNSQINFKHSLDFKSSHNRTQSFQYLQEIGINGQLRVPEYSQSVYNQSQISSNNSSRIFKKSRQSNWTDTVSEQGFKRKITEKKMKKKIRVESRELAITEQGSQPEKEDNNSDLYRHRVFGNSCKESMSTQCSHHQKKNPFVLTELSYTQQVIEIDAPVVENQQKFMKEIIPTEVFFCMGCLRYVFAVQKYYHYPQCQSQLLSIGISRQEKHRIGEKRMEMLKQLSVYTNKKLEKIKEMQEKIVNPDSHKKFKVNNKESQSIANTRKYLSIDQIDLALYSIYQQLLKGYPQSKISSFIKGKAMHFCQGIDVDCGNQIDIM